ncbi:hypothetical protein [Dethiobacter alkaliphilus]|uniref:hypothetical protein n=1 Tax=Dethiobacter alkaliphilus TaxID=427926 RepID=UPI002225F480|nr:hypothetical protein [Dethiobacter alkaliphilus]MCW3489911.1 hypothetical protein [Dethiobacter alkaliphilus]
MTEPNKKEAMEANMRIYKKEVAVVISSVLTIMLIALGIFLMQPFPGLLEVKIWGFPFPYWYQMTIAWLGVIGFVYYIVTVLTKIDDEKAKAKKEV